MSISATIQYLEQQLQKPLPGRTAQYQMAHAVRRHHLPPPENARTACVMILLYPKAEDLHLVLIERMSTHKADRHSGQISFPGGKLEAEDASLLDGALRETQEEVGIDANSIKVLGALTDLYIPVSNFQVYPFVGYLPETAQFSPQPSEVKAIIETPLPLLQNPATVQQTDLRIPQGMLLKNVPFYNVHGHVVWGATAMMLSEFLSLWN
ncbi:MAG: CoA pyrophosphatase [Bacteroidota bacterium]